MGEEREGDKNATSCRSIAIPGTRRNSGIEGFGVGGVWVGDWFEMVDQMKSDIFEFNPRKSGSEGLKLAGTSILSNVKN